MQLIEIQSNKFVNRDAICGVRIHTHEHTKSENLAYELQSSPKKVGESFTLTITTSDGKEHCVDEDFSARIHKTIF